MDEQFQQDKAGADQEVEALASIAATLNAITDDAARSRVVRYVTDRFGPAKAPRAARKAR